MNELTAGKAVLLYFTNDQCAPCLALRPRVKELVREKFPEMNIRFINAADNPELAAKYQVFASPTLILFFDGKETVRKSKYISIQELETDISRYYNLLFENQ